VFFRGVFFDLFELNLFFLLWVGCSWESVFFGFLPVFWFAALGCDEPFAGPT
jgi:hypothetical protein